MNCQPQLLTVLAAVFALHTFDAVADKTRELRSDAPTASRGSRSSVSPLRTFNVTFATHPKKGESKGAVGSPSDHWNFVYTGTTAIDYTRYHDFSSSPIRMRISKHDGTWGIPGEFGVYHAYIYDNSRNVDLMVKLLDVPQGHYRIYVFAHGDAPNQNANIELIAGKRRIGKKATSDDSAEYRSRDFKEGIQYVSFEFEVKAGEKIKIISHRAASNLSMFNAIQLVQLGAVQRQIQSTAAIDLNSSR